LNSDYKIISWKKPIFKKKKLFKNIKIN